jgi:MFS family permease
MRPRQYEIRAVWILCLAWGLANFEIFGINYLLPFIKADLGLSNAQIGSLVAIYWVPFALSSYVTGTLNDRFGQRKRFLTAVLLLFSVTSVLSGFAGTFSSLLAARLLMGVLEGPILPLAQSIVALESSEQHRGMNMGIVGSVGSALLGSFAAPLLMVWLAEQYGWRSGFFAVAVPGLICVALVIRFLREPSPLEIRTHDVRPGGPERAPELIEALRVRNIWLCALCGGLFLAFTTIGVGFMPLYYVKVRHFSPHQMSLLMSVLGVSSLILGFGLPALTDRIGRKPVAVVGTLLGMLCPLAAVYTGGAIPVLAVMMFFGWSPGGTYSLFMSTIPAESVSARTMSTAMGFILAASTLGGFVGPMLAGWSADRWGLAAPMLLLAACSAAMGAASLSLRETAPRRRQAASLSVTAT